MTLMQPPPTPTASDAIAAALASLTRDYSIEATPKAAEKLTSFADRLPQGSRIFIPALPGGDPLEVAALARRLVDEGMRPVPHLAARTFTSRDALATWLGMMGQAGARDLLLIAGDRSTPAGPFASTLDVLATGDLMAFGFTRLCVAGHPEGHPVAGPSILDEALDIKQAYAAETGSQLEIVTQFGFEDEPIAAWLARLRGRGVVLPVRIGLPGPTTTRALLHYAAQCGIGASARVLRRRPGMITRLARRWTPDRLLTGLAQLNLRHGGEAIAGVHVFAFGGLSASIDWFNQLNHGNYVFARGGAGFEVGEPAHATH